MVKTIDFIKEPFVVKENEGEYYIAFAGTNIQASEKKFKNIAEAEKYINRKPWELISAIITVLIKQRENCIMINNGINKQER